MHYLPHDPPIDISTPSRSVRVRSGETRARRCRETTDRAHSPSGSAGRWAAARQRCSWRSAGSFATTTASRSSPTTSSRGRTASSSCAIRHLPAERITAVETGGCPTPRCATMSVRTSTRSEQLMVGSDPDLLFVESGGDNLAAQFSRELADYTIYVIDVSGGDKIPRKGGPGHHPVGPARDQQDRSGAAGRRRSRGHGA